MNESTEREDLLDPANGGNQAAEGTGLPIRSSDLAGLHVLPADVVPLIPVRNGVLFPGMVLPFGIGRPASIAAAQQAASAERAVGLVMQRDSSKDDPQA